MYGVLIFILKRHLITVIEVKAIVGEPVTLFGEVVDPPNDICGGGELIKVSSSDEPSRSQTHEFVRTLYVSHWSEGNCAKRAFMHVIATFLVCLCICTKRDVAVFLHIECRAGDDASGA
eukprot:4988662-Ditylum_brightwellii.AAC.1